MLQLISTGEYIDDNPGHGGDTYAVRVYVLRLNPFTLNEWWKSQILNHRNTYGTEEEWEAYKAGKEKLQTAFKEKVADFLKVDLSLGSLCVTQEVKFMSINIKTDRMRAAILFHKSVLFTPERIPDNDVPDGWHRYDLRGSIHNARNAGKPTAISDHALRTRLTALLLALVCVLGLLPSTAFAAADTIKLKEFGMSGVAYQSAALGKCTLHQMYYENGSATTVGFCGTKGGGMGNSLKGQTWGNKTEISDSTVKIMMAYYYAHSTGVFTDEARALGVDDVWGPEYTWYMNAWVQACIWRYQQGSMSDPVVSCAEEFMAVYNSLEGTRYTSIDDKLDGKSFRDRTQFILDIGNQGVWGGL